MSECVAVPIDLVEMEFDYDDVAMSIGYNDAKSVVYITPSFSIEHSIKKPNWWWRLWQYLFLGFKWDDV